MRHSNPAVEAFIAQTVAGTADLSEKYAMSAASGLTVPEFCNTVALAVATQFDKSQMSFDDADAVMNAVSGLMLHHANALPGKTLKLAEPAWSIYLAFDEGEYDHRDSADPIQKYTVPMVKRAIGDA